MLTSLCAQEGSWKLLHVYESKDIDAWDVDPMGKLIIAERDILVKLDTSFSVQFTQSKKQLGEVEQLDAAHSLKTLVFSEVQQYVSFVDNTLTFQEGIKDLSDYNVAYATNVGYSNQTNRFWVYDGDNSQLLLIDETGNQISKINNLSAITGGMQPQDLFERNNELLLFYEDIGVFFFDYYGSLISHFPIDNASAVHFTKDYLFLVVKNTVIRINRKTQERIVYELPDKVISGIRVNGNSLFLEVPQGIKKYSLIPE
jgi:hypothetical protein